MSRRLRETEGVPNVTNTVPHIHKRFDSEDTGCGAIDRAFFPLSLFWLLHELRYKDFPFVDWAVGYNCACYASKQEKKTFDFDLRFFVVGFIVVAEKSRTAAKSAQTLTSVRYFIVFLTFRNDIFNNKKINFTICR